MNVKVTLGMKDGTQKMFSRLLETDIKVSEGACVSTLIQKDGRVVGVIMAGNGHSHALTMMRLREMPVKAGLRI